jgi:predicted GH43/DUF377 family glycosyl hydrolase
MKSLFALVIVASTCALAPSPAFPAPQSEAALASSAASAFVPTSVVQKYVEQFNAKDEELYPQFVPNKDAAEFLTRNIPRFECPDKTLEEIYYFRWWTFRKHIKQTPDGFIITEFLPKVNWAGKHNSISCAGLHHFPEGGWLRDSEKYLNDYARFWLRGGGQIRRYSFPIAHSLYHYFSVTGNDELIKDLLPDLIKNYESWEKEKYDAKKGLFWQVDNDDGMEMSVSGRLAPRQRGYRATINSYMAAEAAAIAKIAARYGHPRQVEFEKKSEALKKKMWETLWDKDADFYKVLPKKDGAKLADVRELHGYTPWAFNAALPEHAGAWKFLTDPKHFYAPFGPTTTEQSHPGFAISYKGHECLWDGPSWPFSTSITLNGLADLLQTQEQSVVSAKDYFDILKIYTKSHHRTLEDGTVVPWIDENLNPFTGDWISRTRLKTWEKGNWSAGKGGKERGKDYNHSTFCDLIIRGLVGLRPSVGDVVTIHPLVPDKTWEWFCLENIPYHGKTLDIIWDKKGKKYGKGSGFSVFVNGKKAGFSERLGELKVDISTAAPPNNGKIKWEKYEKGPILGGGKLGTIFDISVIKEDDGTYKMYSSWRPKQSLALHVSKDGFNWTEPKIILSPKHAWEQDINRPGVVKKDGVYHLWYTGQKFRNGGSRIGYATSTDGVNFTRQSAEPVIVPELPWEKKNLMCPSVLWDEEEKVFKMWYSGGEQYEPDALGYATSTDGKNWKKHPDNPVFRKDKSNKWEQYKVAGAQIIKREKDYLMFYIGYRDLDFAQIGMAKSPDGISNWVRYEDNPIISPTPDGWDASACYKPFAVQEKDRWLLWYNGRHNGLERISVAIFNGKEIEFDGKGKKEE